MPDIFCIIQLINTFIQWKIKLKDLKENPDRYVHLSIWGGKDKEKDKEKPAKKIKVKMPLEEP